MITDADFFFNYGIEVDYELMDLIMEADLFFYTRKNDWRNEVHCCTLDELIDHKDQWDIYVFPGKEKDEELKKILRTAILMKKNGKTRFKARNRNDSSNSYRYITWEEFDPSKMTVIEETQEEITQSEINLKDMLRSGRAPGILTKTDPNRGSMFHKGKLDEGAMGDLLDRGLEGAETRAKERKKKYGRGFQKKSYGRRIVNANRRKGRR